MQKPNRTLLSFFCVILLMKCFACANAQASPSNEIIEVRSYLDTESAGWAYKKSDYAFVVEIEGCRIQWNVVEFKKPRERKYLSVRKNCFIPFSEQAHIHKAILEIIFSKWPIIDFDSISWGSFGDNSDWSWNIPIAIASSKSEEYRDYRMNYPNSKITSINDIFIRLANEAIAYHDLKQLFQEFDADIELSGVEKVFVSKAKDLPFYPVLKNTGIRSNMRLIYNVGLSYFKIKKQHNTSSRHQKTRDR